jgi:hypothetical protein
MERILTLTNAYRSDESRDDRFASADEALSRAEREDLLRDAVRGCGISPAEDQILTLLSRFDEDTLIPIITLFDRLRDVGHGPGRNSATKKNIDNSRHARTGIGILTA